MYFFIEPKSKKKDFYNYDYQYNQLKKAMERKEKITAVVGVRRVGKTSLLNIIYNETRGLKLWLDGRIVNKPKEEIFNAIYETVKANKPKIFGKIESLNLSAFGFGLGVKISKENRTEIEKQIRRAGQLSIFVDEAQRMKITELSDVLSYFYDRLPSVSFVLSGSEIGLVEEILGVNDSEHSLYGREINKVIMNRMDESKSIDYLIKGFKQTGIDTEEDEIYEAVNELDGLIGWLTLFGYEKAIKKSKDALKKTSELAAQIAATELNHFLKRVKNKQLYLSLLRNTDGTSWNELRAITGKGLRKKLNPNLFNFVLEKLVVHSFIEKRDEKYYLCDPLLRKAVFIVK